MGYIALLGCVFFAAFPFTFNTGLQYTNASRGALLLASMPMWSAWLARRVVGERLSRQQATGVALTVIGIGGVLSERGLAVMDSRLGLVGDLLLLATALLGAVYGVLAPRALAKHGPLTVTAYAMMFGTLLLTVVAIPEGLAAALPRLLDPALLAVVVFLGIPGGAIGFALWTIALSHLSPTQVAVYVNVNPLVATLLGAVLLHERLTAVFFAGFAAVATGVFMVNRRSAQ